MIAIAKRRQRPGSGSLRSTADEPPRQLWPVLTDALRGLRWAVVGAVATRMYMAERATSDLDIVVPASHSAELRDRLRAAGFHYIGEPATGGSTWRAPGGVTVDVLESSESWLAVALERAQGNLDIQGQPVLPLPYLVLMKLASGRTQDVADVSRMLGLASETALDEVRAAVTQYEVALSDDVESLIALGRLEWQDGETPPGREWTSHSPIPRNSH